MTTMTVSNWVTQVAEERRSSLELLSKTANRSHHWAAAAACATMAHVVAAGNALIHARDLRHRRDQAMPEGLRHVGAALPQPRCAHQSTTEKALAAARPADK